MDDVITSRDNLHVKLAVALTRKKERDAAGCFVAEGLRLCVDAVRSGVKLRTLFLTERAGERYPETAALREAAEQVLWVSEGVADKIADTKSPQGVFGICEKLDNGQSAVTIKSGGQYLLLSSIQDPGNLGTVLRTAEAMGIDGVLLSADCPDVYSPKVLRGAMGGVFRLPVAVWAHLEDAIARLQEAGVPVYAAALTEDALRAGQVEFAGGGAVLIGNEGAGLDDGIIAACTASIIIPMAQGANSLNAAMAAGVLLWEMRRTTLL